MTHHDIPIAVLRVKVRVLQDSTGATIEMPGILTQFGLFEPLIDYFLSRRNSRRVRWQNKVVSGVSLFLRYLVAHPDETEHYRLFMNFADRLYTGTFDDHTGLDPSNLCWRPMKSENATNIIHQLTDFLKYFGQSNPIALAFNPRVYASEYDKLIALAAHRYAKDGALLGHTWANAPADLEKEGLHAVRGTSMTAKVRSQPPRFPDSHFDALMAKGFWVGRRLDVRGLLITLLLDAGGLRLSEPFHLYICDVIPDPENSKSALVLIHHPSDGLAPADWRYGVKERRYATRRAYLKEAFGLAPRHLLMGRQNSGYKGKAHVKAHGSLYRRVYWAHPRYGEVFLQYWYAYIAVILPLPRSHPFAFVNTGREPKGAPYCFDKYVVAHDRAVRKIGLRVSKYLGTTTHGHRHAYARRLRDAGVSKETIKECMGHSSIDSQDVYTSPSESEAVNAVKQAFEHMDARRVG